MKIDYKSKFAFIIIVDYILGDKAMNMLVCALYCQCYFLEGKIVIPTYFTFRTLTHGSGIEVV